MKKSLPSNFSHDSAQPRKKKWVLPVILSSAGVLLLLLAAVCFVLWFLPGANTADSDAAYLEAVNNYTEVNDAVAELANTSAYSETEPEEKANQLLYLLEQLEGEGQIASGSVQYNEADQTISYAYADGTFGSIQLKEFSKENSGADASSYAAERDENGRILSTSSGVSFGINGCPYEKAPTALILYGLGDDNKDTLQTLKKDQQEFWSAEYMETALEEDCTVEMFRQVLSGYDLLVLQLHGYLYNDVPTIYLQETTSFSVWSAEKLNTKVLSMEDRLLLDDLRANRIGMMCSAEDGKYHYFLLPEFFTYYYRDGRLNNTIVWLGSCSGYRNDSLVKAFADCGAKAVLGCTETIRIKYDICMEDAFVYKLLYGSTVDEALAFAKSVWGENDSIFWWKYENEEDTDPSEIRYYNGGDQTLVTLTAEAKAALQESEAGTVDLSDYLENFDELTTILPTMMIPNGEVSTAWETYWVDGNPSSISIAKRFGVTCVGLLDFSDPQYSLYGVRIGSKPEEAQEKLEAHGYGFIAIDDLGRWNFVRDSESVFLYVNDAVVNRISYFNETGYDMETYAMNQNSALYENSSLTVSGTLTEQSYEINSANKGVAYILELDEPITKLLYSDDAGYAGESVEISEIQIQFTDNDDYIRNHYLGKHLQVSGSVMFANTGHHLTTILLTDVTVEVEDAEPQTYLSEDEAIAIAYEYFGVSPGEIAEEVNGPMSVFVQQTPSASDSRYLLYLAWRVDNHWSTIDWVYVDGITGACTSYW